MLLLRTYAKHAKPACFLASHKFECKCTAYVCVCVHRLLQWCLSVSVQIENIDACLSFLAAKGVNIQGLSAEGKLDSLEQERYP